METYSSLTLQAYSAILRDIEDIQKRQPGSLSYERRYLQQQDFPAFIIPMSKLGKAVETSLITGTKLVVPDVFPLMEGSNLPRFCFDLFVTIFSLDGIPNYMFNGDRTIDSDGKTDRATVPIGNADTVFLLRQLLLLFSKAEDIPITWDAQTEEREFVRRVTMERKFAPIIMTSVLSVARNLLSRLLLPDGELHPLLDEWQKQPWGRHGPGAVAGGERGKGKWDFVVDCLRLPRLLYTDTYGELIGTTGEPSFTSRMCLVPKDFRGPRIICIEPKELQFAQQGLADIVVQIIESSHLTRRHINIGRQDLSFNMSKSLAFATIDLKDASDSISLKLLKVLLPKEVFSVFTRFRSSRIRLPSGDEIPKYQTAFTMGNALCFPLETLVFWSLAAATILLRSPYKVPTDSDVTDSRVSSLKIRVFGDDIIVPCEYFDGVTRSLRGAGLIVNNEKSCCRTFVREACGSWWYGSRDVRVTKLKQSKLEDLRAWTSFYDVIPKQRESGMFNLASVLEHACDQIYPTPRYLLSGGADVRKDEEFHRYIRYGQSYQRMEYRMPVCEEAHTHELPGRIGLTAYYNRSATRVLYRRAQCKIKYRWVAL